MRHTLLPLNERKTLRKDYFVRLLTVLCFLISVSALLGAATLFPAYLSARNLENAEQGTVKQIKASKEAQNRNDIESRLRSDQLTMTRLLGSLNSYRSSDAIQAIAGARGTITLTSFSYNQLGTSTAVVVIQGKAPLRDDLLGFKTRLLTTFPQSTVDLPISELAESRDIQFSMKITYQLP